MSLTKSELYNFINASTVTGESTYDIWKFLNPDGTEEQFIEAIRGKSALEFWLELEVNQGKTEEDFYKWLGTDNSELITKEISDREAAILQVLEDAKAYTDGKVADETAAREAADTQTLTDAKTYTDDKVSEETLAREAADIQNLETAQTYTDSKIADEALAREAADTQNLADAKEYTNTKIAAEEAARIAIDEQNLETAKSYTDEKVAAEVTARETAITNVETIVKEYVDQKVSEEATNSEANNTQTLTDAKAYTDTQITNKFAEFVGTAPEKLDTVEELAAAMQANDDILSAVNEAVGNKVSKEEGKGLSTNDFTNELLEKVNGIETGAEKNVIVDVKVNGTSLEIAEDRSVNAIVPVLSVDGEGTLEESTGTDTSYETALTKLTEEVSTIKSDLEEAYKKTSKNDDINFTLYPGVINESYVGNVSQDPDYKYKVYEFPLINGAEYSFVKNEGSSDFLRMGISDEQFSNGLLCTAITPTKVENELVWTWTCNVDTNTYKYGFIYPGNATLTGTVSHNEITGEIVNYSDNLNDSIMDILSTQHSVKGFSEYDDIITKYTNEYISDNGLIIDGVTKTKEEIYDWILNGNNYLHRGKITKSGNKILDKNGKELVLTGIGTHYLTRFDELHTKEAFESLKYYGINCVRLSMYLNSRVIDDAYIANPQKNKDIISELVPMLTELGFYIIIDWHAYSVLDGDSTQYATEQAEFFTWASSEFASYDNILYEIFNEPFGNTASELLPQLQNCSNIIRSNVPDAILITGFGSDAEFGMIPIIEDNNLDMFVTAHPYVADTTLNIKPCKDFIEQGKAIFISEWGNADFSGDGITNDAAAEEWMDYLHSNGVSHCIWKYTYNNSTTAVLKNDGVKIKYYYSKGGFNREDLTHNGKVYFDKIQKLNFTR